ncbi:DEAD/DEAH box helicase [Chelatococcus daeguensis]|uniref:DEAD/DEAH box helicase n=1 Tax=Chelatococcus daeguensis TaxID=444444 RepID=UPI0007ABEE9A|nr:DEAD/DEAH box helicase [Chelatococcus daeguensis]KZE36706.1 RNA helicase [Chelatococcus daeguensis]MBM3082337.1 DEAD/DEAH box helicase [Chelatococcus daeguensis]
MTSFSDLGLAQPLLKALESEGYEQPTPIQAQAIPHVLSGRDLLGIAQTGTGKTAAFALPILHRLASAPKRPGRGRCRVLVLSPTRELASQIGESFRTYGRHLNLRTAVIFGGVGHRPQSDALARGLDVLVATPGRLIDHMQTDAVSFAETEVVVLDEADQMLDMGFIHAIRKIVQRLPKERQNLFFLATMPKEIAALASDLLHDPVQVSVTPVATTAERIDQRVIFVETARKRNLLAEILKGEKLGRALVFTRTKHGADRVVRHLEQDGIRAAAIHGNKSQSQRERALGSFRTGETPILVATDIAARGIDVDGVTHVINFDLPNVPESYVHRIGRTARAGADGSAISFCDGEERAYLRAIEKLTRQKIPATDRRANPGAEPEEPAEARPQGRNGGGRNGPGKNATGRGRHSPRGSRNTPQPGHHSAGKAPGHGNGHGHGSGLGQGNGQRQQDGASRRDGQRPAKAAQGSGKPQQRDHHRGQGQGHGPAGAERMDGIGFMRPARRRGDGPSR